jgi:hypothetical protein
MERRGKNDPGEATMNMKIAWHGMEAPHSSRKDFIRELLPDSPGEESLCRNGTEAREKGFWVGLDSTIYGTDA